MRPLARPSGTATVAPRSGLIPRAGWVLLACSTFFFWSQSSRAVLFAALPAMRSELGLSAAQATLTGSVVFAFYVLGSWSSGFLPFSRRATVRLAAALSTLAHGAFALSPSLFTIVPSAALLGFGLGIYLARGVASLAEVVPREKLARAFGLHEMAAVLGLSASPLFFGAVLPFATWRVGVLLWGLVGGLTTLLVWWSIPDAPPPGRAHDLPPLPFTRRMLSLIGVAAAGFAVIVGFLSSLPLILNIGWAITPAAAATFTGVVRLGGPLGALGGGYLGDVWGAETVTAVAFVLAIAILLLTPAFPYGLALGVATLALGILASCITTCFYSLVGAAYPGPVRDRAVGLVTGTGTLLGAGLFPVLLGYLLEKAPLSATFYATAGAAAIGLGSAWLHRSWIRSA